MTARDSLTLQFVGMPHADASPITYVVRDHRGGDRVPSLDGLTLIERAAFRALAQKAIRLIDEVTL